MTGLYTMSLSLGGADRRGGDRADRQCARRIVGRGTSMLGDSRGDCRGDLVAASATRNMAAGGHAGFTVTGLWTDALAWQVTLFMGLQSAIAYTMFGWLPHMLQDRGLECRRCRVCAIGVGGRPGGRRIVRADAGHLLARSARDQCHRRRDLRRRPAGLFLRSAGVGLGLGGRARVGAGRRCSRSP